MTFKETMEYITSLKEDLIIEEEFIGYYTTNLKLLIADGYLESKENEQELIKIVDILRIDSMKHKEDVMGLLKNFQNRDL